jgi:integrase
VLAELLAQVEKGFPGAAPARMTVGEYLDNWLEAIRGTVRPTTAAKYAIEIRRLKAVVGNILLSRLTPADVQAAAARLPETLAPMTRRRTFDTLRTALRQAVEWALLARDPLAGVRPPSAPAREMRVWTEEEARRFLEAAKGSRYYALFYLALATGMRSGELLALTWNDVDLAAGMVAVRRTLAGVSDGAPVWQDPKTPAARRRIPIDPAAVEVLRQHRRRQAEERLKAGPAWQDHGLVFCTRSGQAGNLHLPVLPDAGHSEAGRRPAHPLSRPSSHPRHDPAPAGGAPEGGRRTAGPFAGSSHAGHVQPRASGHPG